jgi:glutaredoxin 3
MAEVEIYTQEWCPYCARAKALFDARGAAYREIPAERGTPAREEAASRAGGRTSVPQIFIDGRHVGGCDDLLKLDRDGKLDDIL